MGDYLDSVKRNNNKLQKIENVMTVQFDEKIISAIDSEPRFSRSNSS